MTTESKIGELCYKAAKNHLTHDEECELFKLALLDKDVLLLIEVEVMLLEIYSDKR